MSNVFELALPSAEGGTVTLPTSGSVLFIGANGSGKTRLGTWMEFNSPQRDRVHRISAQKSLIMPDSTTPVSIEKATASLLFGDAAASNHKTPFVYKEGYRWGNKPAISMLNDFDKLMVLLFSDNTEESAKYLAASKATTDRVVPPITKIDRVKEVWEKILPHRELVIGGLRIQTKTKDGTGTVYNSSEMSDGERVTFYLIGQCMAAQQNAIIIIDEPELHLHKSIQSPLWAEIEKLRSDCLFVYLTHDVDFAVAQESAQKIWLKSFNGVGWEWETVEEVQGLPDELLIQILGTRKPIVFVEGENGSFDASLYRYVLNDFLVIPRGSRTQVIQSVKALSASKQLHHFSVYGLIDRDRRDDKEIAALHKDGIFVLEVAEVENLFCTKEILELASAKLARDPDADFKNASKLVFDRLSSEIEYQISIKAINEIKFKLNQLDEKARGETALRDAVTKLSEGIDVAKIYKDSQDVFEAVISTKDYEALLKIYNRKSLPVQISSLLGLSGGGLSEFIVRLAKGDDRDEIRKRLKKYFGGFPC